MQKVQFVTGLPWALETSLRAQNRVSVSAVGCFSVELGPFEFSNGKEYKGWRVKKLLGLYCLPVDKNDDTRFKNCCSLSSSVILKFAMQRQIGFEMGM